MTKSILPAANAGLPAIDRRTIVYGLGTAAIAGVPAGANAAPMSDDPVFQAMAILEQLKIHAEESDAAHSVAEHAFFAAMKENGVILDGKKMRTHEQIDAHFKPVFGPDYDFDAVIEESKHSARAVCMPSNDELARKEKEISEVEQRIGYRAIEARKEADESAVWDAEYKVMDAEPATTAGAVALLRFVARQLGGDEDERYARAIRAAADFFEGRASA